MRRRAVLLALGLGLGLAACVDGGAAGRVERGLAIEGRFLVPRSTLTIGDEQWVEYTGAGPWQGPEASCAGGMEPGTEVFRQYLAASWPQIASIGGYACRPIVGDSSTTSVHATGRALDVMLPVTSDGAADNDYGDPIARWLIEHAEEIGVQLLIWDRTVWSAWRDPGDKAGAYTGEHPHHDHIHVELSVEAGVDMATAWFAEAEHGPPAQPGCAAIGEDGAVIDDAGDCFTMFGPTRSWRVVEGEGEGGGLLWTNAFQGDAPSNWARWYVDLAAPGSFDVEVHIPDGQGVHRATRYEIVHGGEPIEVELDQAEAPGWRGLGTYDFAAGVGQHVDVFDNVTGSVAADQRIAVDAVRLTATDEGSGGGGPDGASGAGGGCQAGGAGGLGGALAAAATAFATRFRRRRPG